MKEETLQKLAEQLGVAVEVIWAALLKQAPIYAWTKIIFLLIVTTIFLLALKVALINFKKMAENKMENIHDWIFVLGSAVVCMLMGCFMVDTLIHLDFIMAALFNPEYFALKQIL